MAKRICMITEHYEANAVCWNSCFTIQI